MTAWYLIYCKAQQEQLAVDNLERQGYRVYLPKIKVKKRIKGKYTTRIEAMFPRYLFINLDQELDNWAPIRSTLGVSNLIRFGDLPASVPDTLIESIRKGENDEGVHELKVKELKQGDKVRIMEGAMAGYEAIFQAKTSQERVLVLLDVVGKQTRVQISQHSLETLS